MLFKKRQPTNTVSVEKVAVFTKKQRAVYAGLISLGFFFVIRYALWWFKPEHIPQNFQGTSILSSHAFDLILFIIVSSVVFLGMLLRVASWFALWFMAKPKYLRPQKGLRVAFLTCYVPGKEPLDMLSDTLCAMLKVRYPHDTWVLDEGNDKEVKALCERLGVKHFSRKGIAKYNQESGIYRTKTKAGNHNAWRDKHEDSYDIVAQIDMDHVPEPEFFERTLGYFRDEKVGFVGTPQFYKNTENWIARGAGEQSFFFHGPMQQGFYGCDMPFLIGTSHIYRASAMKKIGGYAPTIVEDHLTGMLFYKYGYKGVFVPEIIAKGEGPLNWVDYFNQQMRWSYGLFEILFKHTPRIVWHLPLKQKINYCLAQLYYFTGLAVLFGIFLTVLYLLFGLRDANMQLQQWLAYSFPPFLLANVIQLYTHRFQIDPENEPLLGPLGMFLNLGANIIYAIAFFNFITGIKLRYMVTQKGSTAKQQRVPVKTFLPHLILISLTAYALIVSCIQNHGAVQLRFWALFNVLTLLAVSLSIYWDGVYAYLTSYQIAWRLIRYGVSFSFACVVMVSLAFAYTDRAKLAEAFFAPSFTVATFTTSNTPLAGKVQEPNEGSLVGVSLYNHNDSDALVGLQNQFGKNFAIVGYYQAWGVKDNRFNQQWSNYIASQNSIPMVTWEPWQPVNGYNRSDNDANQQQYRMKLISEGLYDAYITQYAKDVKAYRKPVMIRFAHEMNGNWYPWGSTYNTPQEYIAAWQHVHDIFQSVGATNVTWVWSPNEKYDEQKVPYSSNIDAFYPGDNYVDWVGVSSFNWNGYYKNNGFRTPTAMFSPTVSDIEKFNKPIIITETASADSNVPGQSKGQWMQLLAGYIEKHPAIKAVVWFNTKDGDIDWTVNNTKANTQAFTKAFGNDYFLSK